MKKQLVFLTAILTTGTLIFTACNKEDETPPTITLSGDNPFELLMRTAYVEPGFTATDDEDGDITSLVEVDDSNLHKNVPGSYHIHYNVSDAAGNAATEAEREISVYATAGAVAANYSVIDTCGGTEIFDYGQTIVASTTTRIVFSKFADYDGNTGIYADIDANGNITLPSQTALDIGGSADDHTFSGTGKVTENGFMISYIDQNITASSSTSCKAHFSR